MSRFVPAGTLEDNDPPAAPPNDDDEKWRLARQELEEARKRKLEEGKGQEGGKSLYEVLQANKAAKQEAFEEKNRIKNQFRALEEDEVEFLESVRQSAREQEAAVRKETKEGLEKFKEQQEAAQKQALEKAADQPTDLDWSSKKRKPVVQRPLIKGLKLRKTSTEGADSSAASAVPNTQVGASSKDGANTPKPPGEGESRSAAGSDSIKSDPGVAKPPQSAPVNLGLGDYSSDED